MLARALASGGAPTTVGTLTSAGMVAVGFVLGIPLALQGWAGWQGHPSRPFRPSRAWLRVLWIALVSLIGMGAAITSLSPDLSPLLAPIHAVTMSLPSLIVLGVVGRALQGAGGSWRDVVAGMTSGGSLGVGAALISEGVVVLVFVVVAVIAATMTPGGMEEIASLAEQLRDPAWLADPSNLSELLLSPAVAVSALGLFSVPVPLIEEAFKTLAAGVAGRWIRPHSARAFLWGVASGAGFALVENLFNGALGGAEGWPLVAVTRFGATVMHCFTGGLVGWGWGRLWSGGRPLRLLGSYAAAVAIHGLWNAAAVGVVLLSAGTLAHEGSSVGSAITALGMVALVGTLGAIVAASLLWLSFISRRSRREVAPDL